MESVCIQCAKVCSEPGAHFCPSCGGRLEQRTAAPRAEPEPPRPPPDPALAGELAGARCATHPAIPARTVCTRCGNFACPACSRTDFDNKPLCASCAERVNLGTWNVPWERRAELGIFKGYWETAKLAAFEPQKAFAGLSPQGSWWDAMSYAMVSYLLSLSGTVLLYAGIFGIAGIVAREEISKDMNGLVAVGIVVGCIVGLAILVPVGAITRVYICAGIDHLMLLIVGGGQAGFSATFRGYCYAMSPAMFGLLPGCGVYIWEIWRLVLTILAYKSMHRMTGGRAALAVLLPLGVCCVGYVGLVAVAGALGNLH
jgi:hypothetical protein